MTTNNTIKCGAACLAPQMRQKGANMQNQNTMTLYDFFTNYGKQGLRLLVKNIIDNNDLRGNDIAILNTIVNDYERLYKKYH